MRWSWRSLSSLTATSLFSLTPDYSNTHVNRCGWLFLMYRLELVLLHDMHYHQSHVRTKRQSSSTHVRYIMFSATCLKSIIRTF